MKPVQIILSLLFVVSMVWSCSRRNTPSVSQRTEFPEPPAPLKPTAPVKPAFSADMEAGRVIYTTKCIKCHEAKPVENWTVQQWQPILKSMIRKTKLDSAQSAQVRLYVHEFAKKE